MVSLLLVQELWNWEIANCMGEWFHNYDLVILMTVDNHKILFRCMEGKCKTWTLDSWTGLWTGLWTEIWTRFWTDAHFNDNHSSNKLP